MGFKLVPRYEITARPTSARFFSFQYRLTRRRSAAVGRRVHKRADGQNLKNRPSVTRRVHGEDDLERGRRLENHPSKWATKQRSAFSRLRRAEATV